MKNLAFVLVVIAAFYGIATYLHNKQFGSKKSIQDRKDSIKSARIRDSIFMQSFIKMDSL